MIFPFILYSVVYYSLLKPFPTLFSLYLFWFYLLHSLINQLLFISTDEIPKSGYREVLLRFDAWDISISTEKRCFSLPIFFLPLSVLYEYPTANKRLHNLSTLCINLWPQDWATNQSVKRHSLVSGYNSTAAALGALEPACLGCALFLPFPTLCCFPAFFTAFYQLAILICVILLLHENLTYFRWYRNFSFNCLWYGRISCK